MAKVLTLAKAPAEQRERHDRCREVLRDWIDRTDLVAEDGERIEAVAIAVVVIGRDGTVHTQHSADGYPVPVLGGMTLLKEAILDRHIRPRDDSENGS